MFLSISDFLGQRWRCEECGKEHHVPTKWVQISEGAFSTVPELGKMAGRSRTALIVADEITWEVAGKKVSELLKTSGCRGREVIFSLPLHATDEVANWLSAQWSQDIALVFAVGSGTINDLVKWAASRAEVPYIAVPTAASMNGYTSPISALLIQGFKRTQPCTPPEGVLTEPEVVASAPQRMTAAGYADLMSKAVADVDWQISNLLWGELYCPLPRRLVAEADEWLEGHLVELRENEHRAVTYLLEALLLSGIGMTIAGSSTPSSGAEHLISHWLEMKALKEGKEPSLHGLQVGIGTLVALTLYEMLLETTSGDWKPSESELISPEELKDEFSERYGAISERVLSEFSYKWLSSEKAKEVRLKLASNWEKVKEIVISTWVPPEIYRHRLSLVGAATHPREIGVSVGELREAVLHAREIRRRWTVLDTAFLVGLLPDQVDEVMERCGWL